MKQTHANPSPIFAIRQQVTAALKAGLLAQQTRTELVQRLQPVPPGKSQS